MKHLSVKALALSVFTLSGCTSVPSKAPDVVDLGVTDIEQMLKSNTTTSEQLVNAYLARVSAYDNTYGGQPGLHAIIMVNPNAIAEARQMDEERRAGNLRGPLHGVPIVVKDNYDTADMPTTNGSVALKDFQPAQDATQIKRLRAAGAIIVAKANLHEYAAGVTTISSLGGQTLNPYDQSRNPGGSSGGTAAAVAASFAAGGIGTDTCGSIRLPSSYTSLVGLRPTKGLTSINGVAPLSSTQDVTGPITKTVQDAAMMLDIMAGYDPKDPVTKASIGKIQSSYVSALSKTGLKGKRIALLSSEKHLGTSSVERPTTDVIQRAADELRGRGAEVIEVQLPQPILDALSGSRTTTYEFSRDLNAWLAQPGARFDHKIAALTDPVDTLTLTDIIASGQVTPSVMKKIKEYEAAPFKENASADYTAALANRTKVANGFRTLFAEYKLDAILYPEIKATARKIGDPNDPGDNCGISPYSGFPAINLPAGFASDDGMPVGMELMGLPFTEAKLLSMAFDYEQATKHHKAPTSVPELPH